MPTISPTTQHPRASHSSTAPPPPKRSHAPRGGKNRGLMCYFIGATLVVLVLVLFFNLHGPEGAARSGIGDGPSRSSAGETTGGPSHAEGGTKDRIPAPLGQSSGAAFSSSGAANPAPVAPQTPDSQTPIGREAVGAPRGAIIENGSAQDPALVAPGRTHEPAG
jgi:hypothetical protein